MSIFHKNKKYRTLKLSKSKNKFFEHKQEIFGILLGGLFVILFLSLVSHDATDNSLFYFSSSKEKFSNLVGAFGANLSALLLYFWGSAAYFFVFLFLFFSYILLLNKTFRQEWSRVVSVFLLLISLPTFFRFYEFDFVSKSFPGGLVGDNLNKFFSFAFGVAGTQIFIFTSFFLGLCLFFRLSFVALGKKSIEFFGLTIKYLYKILCKSIRALGAETRHILKIKTKTAQDDYSLFYVAQRVEGVVPAEKSYEESEAIAFSFSPEHEHKKQEEQTKKFEEKFKDKQVFTNFRCLDFGKYKIGLLPNSCVSTNLLKKEIAEKIALIKGEKEKSLEQMNRLRSKIEFNLPDLKMFQEAKANKNWQKDLENESAERGKKLEEKLRYFGIKGNITAIRPGPVITLFEYKPDIDSKISKIVSLEDDLAMALTALSIRIVAPIPGKNVVGFEISNQERQKVVLSDIILSKEFENLGGKLPLILGVDITGNPVVEDLVKMPHLLVAGSTGSGKSVGLNCMLVSLLCKLRPDELKLILIDPKRLEFAPYADIPHLIFPIITNPRNAVPVLKWLVQEMEDRYEKMALVGVRNIVEYHALSKDSSDYENIPFIVLMIDELADLMMVAGKDVETQIARIAQMARAAGIHMITATQRPSVDVVTGLIKVNFPSRIAYRVSSKIDSRTIVDNKGAEKLLGMGDLLYMNSSSSDLRRIHGGYVSEREIVKLSTHLRAEQQVEYLDLNEVLRKVDKGELENFEDDLYPQIIEFLKFRDEISISQLQRHYKIGFNRSARIIERLEIDGLIAPAQGSKPRKVLRGE
jgi:DNA segregation ATPase FtsK/SpoIIIE-like protein